MSSSSANRKAFAVGYKAHHYKIVYDAQPNRVNGLYYLDINFCVANQPIVNSDEVSRGASVIKGATPSSL